MNKQPGSTIFTTIKGSRSCYITTKRFAILCVETILTGKIHTSNDILNWFWILFKNVNALTERQEKGICLIFKRNIPYLSHRCAFRVSIIASAERLKSRFVQAKFTRILGIGTIYVSNENNSAIVTTTIRGECGTHRNCSQKCYTCKQQKIDSCRDVCFTVTQFDNFCKNELITYCSNFLMEKTQVLFFSNRKDNRICLFKCSTISL